MLRKSTLLIGLAILSLAATAAARAVQQANFLQSIEAELSAEVPGLHSVDRNIAISAQPRDSAYAKLATRGFRTVLTLRTASEGVDLKHQRKLVEQAGMRFINIPVPGSDPKAKQVEEFLKVAGDSSNYPMLIHCATGNRAAGFWMIYRVVADGWTEEKALAEAESVGLTSPAIKKFGARYLANRQP